MTTPKRKIKRISKNTHYKRGRQFEYRCKKYFEKLGYYVIRKYASKGAEDLVCIKSRRCCENEMLSSVLVVQCKNLQTQRNLPAAEKKGLIALAEWTGAKPILATNVNHKITITELE